MTVLLIFVLFLHTMLIKFIAFEYHLNTNISFCRYCDVISGNKDGGSCTGKSVNVGGDGNAFFSIDPPNYGDAFYDAMIAIHRDSKL